MKSCGLIQSTSFSFHAALNCYCARTCLTALTGVPTSGGVRQIGRRIPGPRHRRLCRRHERPRRREPPNPDVCDKNTRRGDERSPDMTHSIPVLTQRRQDATPSPRQASTQRRPGPGRLRRRSRFPAGTLDLPTTTRTPTTTRQRLEGKRSTRGLCADADGRYAPNPQVKAGLTADCKSGVEHVLAGNQPPRSGQPRVQIQYRSRPTPSLGSTHRHAPAGQRDAADIRPGRSQFVNNRREMSSPGQISRMTTKRVTPSISPRATTRRPRGRAARHRPPVASRAALGPAHGRATPDRRDDAQPQRARSRARRGTRKAPPAPAPVRMG